jgi:hypothetical protein
MKIGIAVVYMVSERNAKLLDLHLDYFRKNTENSYTIYACVNGLLPQFHGRLQSEPSVKICPCEPYGGGSALWPSGSADSMPRQSLASASKYEHSWYLEQLIRAAIEDGVSHVALFHVDSFPIQYGWDTRLIREFSDRCVLAGVTRDVQRDNKPLTAGTLFPREFYLRYQPRLLLTQAQRESEAYRRYEQACPHVSDSGFGYGFKMFQEGLSWYPLARSEAPGVESLFAGIHGDLIFHLQAAVFIERTRTVGHTLQLSQRRGLVGWGARLARLVLPAWMRQRMRSHVETHCLQLDRDAWEQERRWFLEDPDGYLTYLRTGARGGDRAKEKRPAALRSVSASTP